MLKHSVPRKTHAFARFQWLVVLSTITLSFLYPVTSASAQSKWTGTWTTSPQLVEPQNNPPSPGLANNTIRQVLRVSIGGDSLRVRFSNEFSTSPVTINEAHIAVSTGRDTIDVATDQVLLFGGQTGVTMAAGGAVVSDPLAFQLDPLTTLAITIYFGSTSASVTGHPGSRTTSYILTGDAVANETFTGAVTTDHWYVINTIDVVASDTAAAVAIIGDSITDGRGSGTNQQNRWPDELANRLQENPATQSVGVLNAGIGGNCVLGSCLGPSALSRFDRDALSQSGIRWIVLFEGVNDIGGSSGTGVGQNLINAFTQMIHEAHSNGVFVYGATIMPIQGSFYYSEQHDAERQIVNQWIRTTDLLDGVIDLDLAMRDPADTLRMRSDLHDNDWLHPNQAGHRVMAEAVDLDLFIGRDSLVYVDNSVSLFYEPECATVGSDWNVISDADASNGRYVTVTPGVQSLNAAPTDTSGHVSIPFVVDSTSTYSVFGRLNDPTFDDDSFWIRMDDGVFELNNGLVTSGWEWRGLGSFALAPGEHVLTIGYREDGATLDKIAISNAAFAPQGMGDEALNRCSGIGVREDNREPIQFALQQNYPNPFGPTTSIDYYLPSTEEVTLDILDVSGRTVATLIDNVETAGRKSVTFDGSDYASGVYFARLRTATGDAQTRMMVLVK